MLLGYLLPAVLVIGYSLLNPLRHHLRSDAAVILILTAVQLGLWVWVIVGITRSANRHTARGGKLLCQRCSGADDRQCHRHGSLTRHPSDPGDAPLQPTWQFGVG